MNIEQLKQLQLKIIKKNKIINVISIIVLIISFVFIMPGLSSGVIPLFNVVFILMFVIIFNLVLKGIFNNKDINKFVLEYKNIFVLNSLKKSFENVVYDIDSGLPKDKLVKYGMIDVGDRFSSNDFISGTYKNIKFEQSDIHIEEKHIETDSDGHTHVEWETLFMGRWMIFDFNKKFRANVQIVSYGFDCYSLPLGKKFSKIELDDVEFNKMFVVNAEDAHDVFYILTPHFMEKIKSVVKKLNASVMLCFIDNRLHIAIDNYDDSFECDVFKVIDEEKINEEIMKDINIIMDFVNDLDLDNDLFGKGV